MLDEFLCVGICIVSGYLIFFCFQKPVEFHPFNVINIDHTTSEILYEMKLHYNTRKVQRWWRSSIISQKRDDISEEKKQIRLVEIINLQQKQSLENNKNRINKTYEVLIEGVSKKSDLHYYGRTTHNCVVVFEKNNYKIGDYVNVKINDCSAGTLKGKII